MKEKFPKPVSKNEEDMVIDALIHNRVDSMDSIVTRVNSIRNTAVGGEYIKSPRIIDQSEIRDNGRNKFGRTNPESKNEKSSIKALVYGIMGYKYHNKNAPLRKNVNYSDFFYANADLSEYEDLADDVFSDPVIQVLTMDAPIEDLEYVVKMGEDLEIKGKLDKGITDKSFLLRLKSELPKLHKYAKDDGRATLEKLKQYTLVKLSFESGGITPLTEEEATPIIEKVVGRILEYGNYLS